VYLYITCLLDIGRDRNHLFRAEIVTVQCCRWLRYLSVLIIYGTVRYGTVRYGTVRYGTVRYGTVRYGTVRYGQGPSFQQVVKPYPDQDPGPDPEFF
jgi:hypothetical protein